MGCQYSFACPRCAYLADVSGGPDRGFMARTVTVACLGCRELRDVEVATLNVTDAPPCASSGHSTTLWAHPGPCPRCGETLNRGESTVDWD
jgi:hypothetical protein